MAWINKHNEGHVIFYLKTNKLSEDINMVVSSRVSCKLCLKKTIFTSENTILEKEEASVPNS